MEELHGSRGITRRAFVALGTAAAASLVLGRETAFAATSWGKTGTKTLSGITYTYRAGIDPGPAHKAHAYVSAKPKVGASQLAAKALIYDASGMLLASGGWKYGDGSSAYATISKTFLGGAQGGGLFLKKAGGSNSYTMSRAKTSRSGERFRVGESGATFGSLADATDEMFPDYSSVLAATPNAQSSANWNKDPLYALHINRIKQGI